MAQDPSKGKEQNNGDKPEEKKGSEPSNDVKEHLKKLRTTSHAVKRLTREMEEYEKELAENQEEYDEAKRKWLDASNNNNNNNNNESDGKDNNNNNNNNSLASAESAKRRAKDLVEETESVIRDVKGKLGQYWDSLDSLINSLPKNIENINLDDEQTKIISDAKLHRENAQKYVNDGNQSHYDDDDEL